MLMMKRLSLRLFCLFFVAIICLAPLSAIDSSQDNGTSNYNQSIDDNGTSEIEIANETEIPSANKTINGNSSDENNTEIPSADNSIKDNTSSENNTEIPSADNSIKDNTSSENNTENKFDPNLKISVENIREGEYPEVVVTMDKSLSVHQMMVYVGKNSTSLKDDEWWIGYMDIENGVGRLTVPKEFPSGTYGAQAIYTNHKVYTDTTYFNITERCNIDYLNVYAANFTTDEKQFVAIETNNDINENVDLIIDNPDKKYSKKYSVKLEKGISVCKLDALQPGRHIATVKFYGDDKYKQAENDVEFFVSGSVNSELKININDTVVGQSPVAEIHANESFNDRVRVGGISGHLGEMPYVKNGYCKYEFTEWNDLPPGNYTVTLNYFGDETYKTVTTKTRFEVKEKN